LVPDFSTLDIAPTDLLFHDLSHGGEELYLHLTRNHKNVSHYIVVHCTETFGERNDAGQAGVMPGIRSFLKENTRWTAIRQDMNNHGLIVLSCRDEDKTQPPGLLRKALNFTAFLAFSDKLAATEEVYNSRIDTCLTCADRFHDMCGGCGCPIRKKASYTSEMCGAKEPKPPKWLPMVKAVPA
jgi:hypothetical protein